MPSQSPPTSATVDRRLSEIGAAIRARRKALGVNAVTAAEAAGLSRVTLYRVEKGEPSVTLGAYLSVMDALGLNLTVVDVTAEGQTAAKVTPSIPVRIELSKYPQLRQLAWQVHGTDELTPQEAFGIYERNWRHLDKAAMGAHELELVDALRAVFEGKSSV
ncbi:helix-turn-helix domain-containing protein [Gilvimarinus sp. F26214L]|uniref:helix-turn-helix domain-containing protein n=1 Tax=Gilvimarinus sp. DZF01 TaxID=3461371 RepID=UPI0040468473